MKLMGIGKIVLPKNRPILTLILLLAYVADNHCYASHIFGGYINMVQLDQGSGKFLISMNTYLDMAELKNQDDIDVAFFSSEEVKIYRKKDNVLMRMWVWPRPIIDTLIYKNRACAEQKRLNTWVFKYQMEITLPPKEFSDPDGYYIARERCCRNAALTNIQRPSDTGMVFYSEFPSLFQNGQPIQYSSPVFGPLNGDYLCANKTSKYDFSATDPDGDELRYTLTDPVKGNTGPLQIFITFPGPYLPVEWLPGYSAMNAIPGTIPLRIDSKSGMLTVRANRIGLFVFSVQVEKIRNGKRIGMIRHEFQLPVVDCSAKTPPVPIITYQGKPVTELAICPNEIITLETEFNNEWAFQWQKNGDNLDNAVSNKLQVKDVGEYTIVKSFLKTCSNDTIGPAVKLKVTDKVTHVKINASGQSLCYGDSLLLKAFSTDSVTFEWSKNGTMLHLGNVLRIKESGTYRLQASKSNFSCSGAADSIQIQELPPLKLPLSKDTTLCEGDTISLQTAFIEGWQYSWFKEQKPLIVNASRIMITQIGTYQVNATDLSGCKGSATYQIAYDPDCKLKKMKIYIPDVFTPNGDGINDTFEIKNIEQYSDNEVTIFNRWGEIIFHSINYQRPWDGTISGERLPTGIYVYKITLRKEQFSYSGPLTIAY